MKTSMLYPKGILGILAGISILLATGCGSSFLAQSPNTGQVIAPTVASSSAPNKTLASGSDFSTAIRDVAARVRPAVVQITNEQVQIDQFNQTFTVPAGVGSGVIYDRQGYILTNNHVVEGAQKLLVSLPDGRSFPAQVIGRDPQTDLAVVKVNDAGNLPTAELGDSDVLKVGDWVVAIGNALALPGGPTVTTGVVSALGRTIQEPGGPTGAPGPFLFNVIQTDAPINPGNSGGPLVNLAGQVIGINTLVAGQAEPGVQAQGIGFSVAIATAKPIADQLVATGRAIHPYLGVGYIPLTPSIAAQLSIPQSGGALVRNIVAGSPAAKGGLQRGDVITEIDGKALDGESALAEAISAHKVGDSITLKIVRRGQKSSIRVILGELQSQ